MAHDLEPPPAAPNPTDTPAPAEPAFLARARRILAGDVRPDDYLPVPDTVRAEVKKYLATLPFEVTPAAERTLLNQWVLQHHHANNVIFARVTDRGVLVLAVGDPDISVVYQRLAPDHTSGFGYMFPSGE